MALSRREFLASAAGWPAIGTVERLRRGVRGGAVNAPDAGCALLDCGSACTMMESRAGYESALASFGLPYRRVSIGLAPATRILILPAAHLTSPSILRKLRSCLDAGSRILFESGTTFLAEEEFRVHQQVMKSEFGLDLCSRQPVWQERDSFKEAPYVNFNWPIAVRIRDFSRIIPISCEPGDTVARFNGFAVAVRKRIGRGMLVFLGSPLGPHLWAGDRQARQWLAALCTSCQVAIPRARADSAHI